MSLHFVQSGIQHEQKSVKETIYFSFTAFSHAEALSLACTFFCVRCIVGEGEHGALIL